MFFCGFNFRELKGSRSDRPRYHAYTRWTSPLPLASAAPRRTPRRAEVSKLIVLHRLLTLTYDVDFQFPAVTGQLS